MNRNKKYNIGLDIGTESVGWAVTDPNTFKVLRIGKKKLWGVRLFEEGQAAATRRSFRCNRRRLERRRQRILYLQEIFGEEIEKIDSSFFIRLKDSFLYKEDKSINQNIPKKEKQLKYNLFIDKEFNDSDFYQKYPTIYHLRYELMEKPVNDIRLIYLAMHHIIKYRGNFLQEGKNIDVTNIDIIGKLENIFQDIKENYDDIMTSDYDVDYNHLKDILLNSNLRKTEKQKLIVTELTPLIEDKNSVKNIANLLSGMKANLLDIFSCEAESDEQEKLCKISFDGNDYEEKISELEEALDKNIDLIQEFKELYDEVYLSKLFQSVKVPTLSYLMIEKYNKHKEDKKLLKEYLNEQDKRKFFAKDGIYQKHVKTPKECNYDDLSKELRKILSSYESSNKKEQIFLELEKHEFLPKITDTSNGIYPYQLNLYELNKIIEVQSCNFPFLSEKLEDGTYKIAKLLTFRIPYYVGPLNRNIHQKDSKAWIVKNSNEKITPFNFDRVVNKIESANQFIKRMTSNCTYLYDEKAMPANSLLYSKFKVLNELKQIKINGKRIDKDLEIELLNNLFMKIPKVTDKIFKKYLMEIKYPNADELMDITGYSSESGFANHLKPYLDFIKIFGLNYVLEHEEVIENLIEWITVFEDKKILKMKIKKEYSNFDEQTLKKICNLKYKGWSALSRKLLTNVYYVDEVTKERSNIIELLEQTDENFMQILFNKKYCFQDKINKLNFLDGTDDITIEDIQELATSPANKRAIWQTIQIIKELVSIIGYPPEHVFIEMARGAGVKKRKDSRPKQLLHLYENCKNDIENYNRLQAELGDIEKFDHEKYFLYYLQQGKSLYSGKPISLSDLNNCEIDHIIPRPLIKDDSLDNKALVFRQEIQDKGANNVLPSQFRTPEVIAFWQQLKKNKFISEKKYHNLTRNEFREKDIEGFINRQLVETRQITKHVAGLLNNLYDPNKNVSSEDTVVQFIHANISHNYREKYELFKYRQLNNFHHGHDAYLAAVLGNYKTILFKNVKVKEFITEYKEQIKIKDTDKKCYGIVIDNIENDIYDEFDKKIFDAKQFKETVMNHLYHQDMLMTRKTEIYTGEFYNQTIYKKGIGKVALKNGLDPNKYGGYNSINCSYLVLVKYLEKGNQKQKLIGIPIMYTVGKDKKEKIDEYIKKILKTNCYEFINKNIPFNSLIKYNDNYCFITGYSGGYAEVCNAQEFILPKVYQLKFKDLLRYIFSNSEKYLTGKEEIFNTQLDEFIKIIIEQIETKYPLYENEALLLQRLINSDKYICLTLLDKKMLVQELFNMLKTNSTTAKLGFLKEKTNIGFVNAFGRKNGVAVKEFTLHHQSITGLKEDIHEF